MAMHWTLDMVRAVVTQAKAQGLDGTYPVLVTGLWDTIEARAASAVTVCVSEAIR
jgi:hypothetical protein